MERRLLRGRWYGRHVETTGSAFGREDSADDGTGVSRGGLGEGRAIRDAMANKLVFNRWTSRIWSQLATVPNCTCGINVEDLSPSIGVVDCESFVMALPLSFRCSGGGEEY
jgi:hypothetical protein